MLCRKIDLYEQKKHIFEIENNGYSIIRSYIHEDGAKELELIAKNLFKELNNNSKNHQAPIGFQNIIKHDLIVNNAPCLSKEFLEISTLGDHLKILTSDGGLFEPQTQMKKIYNLLFENIKNFQKIISHNITLNNINKGIDYVKKGKAIRVSIKF